MSKIGFFTREEANAVKRPKGRQRQEISEESLRRLGPEGVRNMNPDAISPEMEPDGNPRPLVYVLGEAPGETEDVQGEPFVGVSGRKLRNALPDDGEDTLFDNCVRTRPPANRDPKRVEVECFRGVVEASIESTQPRLILGVGKIALNWATGLTNIKATRGKLYPVKIGEHKCWFMPILHPSFLLRIAESREDKVPGREWERVWEADIARAYKWAAKGNQPVIVSPERASQGIEICRTVKEVERALAHLEKADLVGWDFETNCLRPYKKGAKVLSVALSDGKRSFAFGLDHAESGWTREQRKFIIERLGSFFVAGAKRVVAHNLPFEVEWALHLWGLPFLSTRASLECSWQAAFVLDPGPPGEGKAGHSLNDLCVQHFGLPLKSITFAAQWRDRLEEMPLEKLLPYNALDAKLCQWLFKKLWPRVIKVGLRESYVRQRDRVVPVVMAQRAGVHVAESVTRKFQKQFKDEADQILIKINNRPEIRDYESRYGRFNPASQTNVGKLLANILGVPNIRTSANRYSTSAKVLKEHERKYPIVKLLLELRGMAKLRGTYVERFLPEHTETYVYPDGKIHCQFGISKTSTSRLQSDSPNNQNWPIRKHKEVRKQLIAPPGYIFVAADQGQIEARMIGCESRDPVWVKMIHDDYDVHMEWAEKLVRLFPTFWKECKKDMKIARARAKNEWVFPAFYGSSSKSIIFRMNIEERPALRLFDEFWNIFAGVKKWQQRKWKEYEQDLCVWSLTGRRRNGPLSFQMVINSGPQTDASDIVVDAMGRLSVRAIEEDKPWLQAVLQVHDDLKFLVPKPKLEESVEDIVTEQVGFKADWLNVPLMVEVETGVNLFDMEPIGKWRSDQI